jgi:epidermal growth factor receptor kinase substrate 8
MRKLRMMEKTHGIWTMECQLLVDKNYIVVYDKKNGNEVESFPVSLVADPTCVISNDKKDTFNNIVLFTVLEDTRKKPSSSSSNNNATVSGGTVSAGTPPSEMHIFQCLRPSHSTEIVDEIYKLKESQRQQQQHQQQEHAIPIQHQNQQKPSYHQKMVDANNNNSSSQYIVNSEPTAATRHRQQATAAPAMQQLDPERVENDVKVLNHCFDDIERFVARLQNALEYTRELEKKRKERRSPKKSDGMLGMRAQMPSPQQFVDIFQKFKLSFNMLARLKAFIHEPNAPELVHFLFTPLALIVNATRDPAYRGLTQTVWQPLMSRDAKELLVNCLTSKEQDLWESLGEAWLVTREDVQARPNDYRHLVAAQPYAPVFADGWSPSPAVFDGGKQMDAELARMALSTAAQVAQTAKYQQSHQPAAPVQKTRSGHYPSSVGNTSSSAAAHGDESVLNSSQQYRPNTSVHSTSGKAAPISTNSQLNSSQMHYAQQQHQQSFHR